MSEPDPLAARRAALQATGLDEGDVAGDPFVQFRRWFDDCVDAGMHEPEAMVLGTVGADGRPSSRHVLLKGLDHGFVFFTNHLSRKGRELAARPVASLCFPWHGLSRQVRVTGDVEAVSEAESDAYFTTRPRGAQLGAWASRQSEVIADRATLEAWVAEVEARFEGREVPRPSHWGGFRVLPLEVELWQGRPSRLHDRLRYRRDDVNAPAWALERLSP